MAAPASCAVLLALLCCLLGKTSADEACGNSLLDTQQFPWHVLVYKNTTGERHYICGGSLIKPRWAVFAAHCFKGESSPELLGASLGKTVRSWDRVEDGEQHRLVNRIFTNVDKDIKGRQAYDIALVEFDQDADITSSVWPLCIDLKGELTPLQDGDEGIMFGYGYEFDSFDDDPPKDLKRNTIHVVDREKCEKFINGGSRFNGADKFCVDAQRGSVIGFGDSAAGFARQNDGRWYLRGVPSVGVATQSLTFFTNVTAHASWMSKIVDQ
ncbi:hypothetical protein ONE63_003375 [Megalurothrips usitatus]|uniref:Peptidase S1 domain-containing protein n=1 Tax=Megalurothrips usitatus TaxID=439358 RepID=A0AAV7X741_9NEOP|nr:hypothetical protein ONE63_003375 [Megalurothrips usitatus]